MSNLPLADKFPQADDAAWMTLVEKALEGADFDKALVSQTYDGLKIRPLYTRVEEIGADCPGLPGSAPYTRGFRAIRSEPSWAIRQLHAAADPAEANAAILQDVEGGATAIALQVAAPGQAGMKLKTAADLERALDGVALDLAGVWLESGHNTAIAAQALQEVWKKRDVDRLRAIGGFGADPLGTLARTGGYPLSLEQALEEMTELAKLTLEGFPRVTAVCIDARPYHNGGASEAQELACLCATTVAYLRAAETSGFSPTDAVAQMEFALACDTDFFAGIAKLRAARALIARIADVSGANSAVPGLQLHAMTSLRMFARRDPHVNILRTTIACAAAALGGADSITVLPYTYVNGETNALARRIARNVQIVLQEEASLGAVIDPVGGSWHAEVFTRDLTDKAWELFQDIEREGGMAEALAKGFVRKMIAETAEKRARDVTLGVHELIGVSSFPNLAEDTAAAGPRAVPDDLADPAITVEPVPLRRPAEPFERLRDAADAYFRAKGERPKVALVTLGPEINYSERVTDARRFFAAGGIEATIVKAEKYDPATSPIACLCAGDEDLNQNGAETAAIIKGAGAKRAYAMGRPGDLRKTLRDAGVDGFLHRGCDMIEILEDAHDVLGLKQR